MNPKYVVIQAGLAEDSPTQRLYDWLLGEDGQRLIAQEGYVSVMDMDFTAPKVLPQIGSRWYEEYTDHLKTGDGYGTLIPYAGVRLMGGWPAASGCLFGLMTTDGRVVTDPVYAEVSYFSGMMLLTQGEGAERGAPHMAAAALDGRWCTDFVYIGCRTGAGADGLGMIAKDRIDLMEPDGSITATVKPMKLGVPKDVWDEAVYNMEWDRVMGRRLNDWVGLYQEDDAGIYYYFDLKQEKVLSITEAEWTDVWNAAGPNKQNNEGVIRDRIFPDAPYILEIGYPAAHYLRRDFTPCRALTLTWITMNASGCMAA